MAIISYVFILAILLKTSLQREDAKSQKMASELGFSLVEVCNIMINESAS
jgi:hypothetical protein